MPAITKTKIRGYTTEAWAWSEDIVDPLRIPNAFYYPYRVTTPFDDSKTGENLPGWKQLILNEQPATTPFTGIKRFVKGHDFDVSLTRKNVNLGPYTGDRTYRCKGNGTDLFWSPSSAVLDPPSDTAEQAALLQLYKRIRKNHQSFSGLTFLGELRQAVKMVRRPALLLRQGLDGYVHALKVRSRGIPFTKAGKAKRKEILAGTWLEFSFGWTPLLSDIKGAADVIIRNDSESKGFDTRRYRIAGKGASQVADATYESTFSLPPEGDVQGFFTVSMNSEKTIRYIVGESYTTRVPSGSAKRLVELSGFNFAEFIPTAWELVPWSFLIDYFSNIGDVLEAFATPTDNIYFINKTIRTSTVSKLRTRINPIVANNPDVSIKFGEYCCGAFDSEIVSFSRSAVSPLNLALPRFQMENPFGKNVVLRSLNMIALAIGMKSLKPFY